MEKTKRILIVEDDGGIYKLLKDELPLSVFEIQRARAVDEARGAVEEEQPFDCFIVDLQILSSGLTLEEMAKYQDREGYAFLKNYLWKGDDDMVSDLKRKSIICSRYVPQFVREYGSETDDYIMVTKDIGFEKEVARLVKHICKI